MHKNSNQNMDDHHLYAIIDSKNNDVFKYGISGDPLLEDNSSPRANKQVKLFNRIAGWVRYFAKVLLTQISGRKKAEEIEEEYIQNYIKENGKRPKGNPSRKRNTNSNETTQG